MHTSRSGIRKRGVRGIKRKHHSKSAYGTSVTQRIKEIKQPRGGYVKLEDFSVSSYDDGLSLIEPSTRDKEHGESIHPAVVGLICDYTTRYLSSCKAGKDDANERNASYEVSIRGLEVLRERGNKEWLRKHLGTDDPTEFFYSHFDGISMDLSDESINNIAKVVQFDQFMRNVASLEDESKYEDLAKEGIVDDKTCANIRTMLNRSQEMFKTEGGITQFEFSVAGDNDAKYIQDGDGDFCTKDTLFDMKVSAREPNNNYTLQLLTYYIMGFKQGNEGFEGIRYLGFVNPRLNKKYKYDLRNVDENTFKSVSMNVIGYSRKKTDALFRNFSQNLNKLSKRT